MLKLAFNVWSGLGKINRKRSWFSYNKHGWKLPTSRSKYQYIYNKTNQTKKQNCNAQILFLAISQGPENVHFSTRCLVLTWLMMFSPVCWFVCWSLFKKKSKHHNLLIQQVPKHLCDHFQHVLLQRFIIIKIQTESFHVNRVVFNPVGFRRWRVSRFRCDRSSSPRSATTWHRRGLTMRDAHTAHIASQRIIGQSLHVNFLRPQNLRWDLCIHADDKLSSRNKPEGETRRRWKNRPEKREGERN